MVGVIYLAIGGPLIFVGSIMVACVLLYGLFVALFNMVFPSSLARKFARLQIQKELKSQREGGYSSFLFYFETKGISGTVCKHTYNYLNEIASVTDFPVQPSDSLTQVFGMYTPQGPDMQRTIQQIAVRCNVDRYLVPSELSSPKTVEELVTLIASLCKQEPKDILLRPSSQANIEMLVRPAQGTGQIDTDKLVHIIDTQNTTE